MIFKRKGFLVCWIAITAALTVSLGANAEKVIYLCYSQDTGIVGDGPQGDQEYETCSNAVAAGETIEPFSARGNELSIPIEVLKPFDSASPLLRQFALNSQVISGYLLFLDGPDTGKARKLFQIDFQNASIEAIKIDLGDNMMWAGVEYIRILPEQITWSVFEKDGGGGSGSVDWDLAKNGKM